MVEIPESKMAERSLCILTSGCHSSLRFLLSASCTRQLFLFSDSCSTILSTIVLIVCLVSSVCFLGLIRGNSVPSIRGQSLRKNKVKATKKAREVMHSRLTKTYLNLDRKKIVVNMNNSWHSIGDIRTVSGYRTLICYGVQPN